MDFSLLRNISLIFILSIFLSSTYASSQLHAIVCEQTYALCTSAPCLPDPKNPSQSICDCAVNHGKSAGFTSCEKRKPYLDQYKSTHLVSTFSFEQFTDKNFLSCPKGMPWSNCVDMPCTVNPQNANRAVCLCQLNATQAFFTFGGNCESSSCSTGFWSGAIKGEASDALRNALLNNGSKLIPAIACPVSIKN